jgi:hypothetical protein
MRVFTADDGANRIKTALVSPARTSHVVSRPARVRLKVRTRSSRSSSFRSSGQASSTGISGSSSEIGLRRAFNPAAGAGTMAKPSIFKWRSTCGWRRRSIEGCSAASGLDSVGTRSRRRSTTISSSSCGVNTVRRAAMNGRHSSGLLDTMHRRLVRSSDLSGELLSSNILPQPGFALRTTFASLYPVNG